MGFYKFFLLILISTLFATGALLGQVNSKEIIYIGTFSERESMGIYVYEMFRGNMRFDLLQAITSKKSPGFITLHPNKKLLFAANREGIHDKNEWGSVTSYSIDPQSGKLKIIRDQYSFGDSPCHVSVHPSGRYIIVCHYRGGNFVILTIDEQGGIGVPTANIQLEGSSVVQPQQSQAHPHSAVSSEDGRFLYISDLGQDKIFIYKFNAADGSVESAEMPFIRTMAGAGPRHFVLNPKGTFAFSSEELSSSIASYSVNQQDGSLQFIQRLPALPPAFFGENSSADIHLALNGKFVYVSNRGYNGLAMYRVDRNGRMKNIGYMPTIGERPRGFLPDPKGEFMLVGNRDSDEINIFTIQKNGTLKDTGAYLPVPASSCIKYLELN